MDHSGTWGEPPRPYRIWALARMRTPASAAMRNTIVRVFMGLNIKTEWFTGTQRLQAQSQPLGVRGTNISLHRLLPALLQLVPVIFPHADMQSLLGLSSWSRARAPISRGKHCTEFSFPPLYAKRKATGSCSVPYTIFLSNFSPRALTFAQNPFPPFQETWTSREMSTLCGVMESKSLTVYTHAKQGFPKSTHWKKKESSYI